MSRVAEPSPSHVALGSPPLSLIMPSSMRTLVPSFVSSSVPRSSSYSHGGPNPATNSRSMFMPMQGSSSQRARSARHICLAMARSHAGVWRSQHSVMGRFSSSSSGEQCSNTDASGTIFPENVGHKLASALRRSAAAISARFCGLFTCASCGPVAAVGDGGAPAAAASADDDVVDEGAGLGSPTSSNGGRGLGVGTVAPKRNDKRPTPPAPLALPLGWRRFSWRRGGLGLVSSLPRYTASSSIWRNTRCSITNSGLRWTVPLRRRTSWPS
eukprot:scaffold1085_cov252-Pinguiococcus_pyrenoidosus.AAC.8